MRSIDDAQLEQLKAPNTNFEELLRHRIHQENASEFSSENGVVAQSDHFTPARHGEAGRLKPSEARAQRNRRPRASDHDENGEVKPATSTNLPEDSNLHADEAFIHQLESLSSKEEAGKRAQVPKRPAPTGSSSTTVPSDAVTMFMRKASAKTLLSRDEEVRLSGLVQRGKHIENAVDELKASLGREPSWEEVRVKLTKSSAPGGHHYNLSSSAEDLQAQVQLGRKAAGLMVRFNLRLVAHIARKFTGRGVELPDLISEGLDGLSRAVDRFDASRGFKFSTYAHWWVRQAVSRCITDQSRVVRLPVHVYDVLLRINRVRRELREEMGTGEEPTVGQIAQELDMRPEKVERLLQASRPLKSLDSPVKDDKGRDGSLAEMIAWNDPDRLIEESRNEVIREDINILLATLQPRERNVLRMRYGLAREDGSSMTFNDIGAAYGLTRERIRQIEDKALKKLRHPMRKALLRTHLYKDPDNNNT